MPHSGTYCHHSMRCARTHQTINALTISMMVARSAVARYAKRSWLEATFGCPGLHEHGIGRVIVERAVAVASDLQSTRRPPPPPTVTDDLYPRLKAAHGRYRQPDWRDRSETRAYADRWFRLTKAPRNEQFRRTARRSILDDLARVELLLARHICALLKLQRTAMASGSLVRRHSVRSAGSDRSLTSARGISEPDSRVAYCHRRAWALLPRRRPKPRSTPEFASPSAPKADARVVHRVASRTRAGTMLRLAGRLDFDLERRSS